MPSGIVCTTIIWTIVASYRKFEKVMSACLRVFDELTRFQRPLSGASAPETSMHVADSSLSIATSTPAHE